MTPIITCKSRDNDTVSPTQPIMFSQGATNATKTSAFTSRMQNFYRFVQSGELLKLIISMANSKSGTSKYSTVALLYEESILGSIV